MAHLSIAENMFAGHLPGRFGLYDERTTVKWAREALEVFGLRVDPRARSASLTPSERRLIVLSAALHRSARVLILDEPTAALTDVESAVLLEQLRLIRNSGVGIVYITHRLDELDRIADRVMVLRNGAVVEEYDSVLPETSWSGPCWETPFRQCRPWRRHHPSPKLASRSSGSKAFRSMPTPRRGALAHRTSASTYIRARSSASMAWSEPGAPNLPERCSGCGPDR